MILESPAFENGGEIPEKFTCNGDNVNPELRIGDVPDDAKSLVLSVEDPDAPDGLFVHWFVWNIDPHIRVIEEDSVPDLGIEAVNGFGETSYGGPCPPQGNPHRYFFKVYALDEKLDHSEEESIERLLPQIERHALATAELMGIYKR